MTATVAAFWFAIQRAGVGSPAAGNGVLYTADSAWRMQNGKLVKASDAGNEFLPLIEGVYMQPVDQTLRQLASSKIDMQRIRFGDWRGHPVVVVGASMPADTTSPQFWVDRDRNVVLRFITAPLDVTLDGYERLGDAWLATDVKISSAGQLVQEEQYADWKANVPLAPALFDVAQWTTVSHWAKPPRAP